MLCVLYTPRSVIIQYVVRVCIYCFLQNQRQQFCSGPKISNVIREEHHFLIRIGIQLQTIFDGAKKDILRYSLARVLFVYGTRSATKE